MNINHNILGRGIFTASGLKVITQDETRHLFSLLIPKEKDSE
jgi:hypothetical protein